MTKTLTWIVALGLAATASLAQARSDIQSVTLHKGSDGTHTVLVKGIDLAKPTVIAIPARKTTIVEFAANLRTAKGSFAVDSAGVATVTYGWYSANPPKVRVAFRTNGAFTPKVVSAKGGWAIEFGTPAAAPKVSKPVAPVSQPAAEKTPAVPKLPTGDALPMPGEAGAPTPVPGSPLAQSQTAQASYQTRTETTSANQSAAVTAGIPAAQMVSLDFVSTDIIQILKALSIQSGVNIVSSPEVSPNDKPVRVTISLNRVSLDEALTYVTAIANLRYAKVGNTYIVTPAENFSAAMRQVMERMGGRYETRVVNLISGQAQKIKEAVEKALSPAGPKGFYEVIVPTANDLPGVALDNGGNKDADGKTQPAKPTPAGRVYYLMVVGDPERVTEVDNYIRELDQRIADSSSFNRKADMATVVVPVQSGETNRIKMMIDRLVSEHPRAAEFSIQESILEGTTKGEPSTMTLLMIGPKEDVAKLENFAKALDKELCAVMGKSYEEDLAGLEKQWEVVELMYIEPTLAELDLKSRFKGLQVSLMPNPVTPGMSGKSTSSETSKNSTGQGSGAAGASGQANGGGESQTSTSSSEKTITGIEPMKIVLRGTRSQIEEAKAYLAMVDIAPKQIALELRVLELTQNEALRLGIDWNLITGGRLNPFRSNQGAGDTAASPGTVSGGIQFNANDSATFLASIDKLNGGRNLIARPNALVSDGRTANLFVGDTVRYIKTIQATQTGTTVETDEVQVGVTFKIGARIGGDGQITLNLDQNFNILTGFTPVPGGGQLPQTSDRLTSMVVNMHSGETLAVGGLILEQDRKRVSGIPLLKDLPIVGALFQRTDNSKDKTEIVFILTAHEVDASNRGSAASPAASSKSNPDPLGDYQRSRAPKGGGKGEKALR